MPTVIKHFVMIMVMLTTITAPGNVHDSVSFFEKLIMLSEKYKDEIKNICLDAGYNSAICKIITDNNQKIIVPITDR